MTETNESATLLDRQLPQRDLSLTLQNLMKALKSIEELSETDEEFIEIKNLNQTTAKEITELQHNAAIRVDLSNPGYNFTNALARENNIHIIGHLIGEAEGIHNENFTRELCAKIAALRVAAQRNNTEDCVLLINSGANIKDVLLWAAKENNLPILESLIEAAEDISDTDFAEKLNIIKTAVCVMAAHHGHIESAQHLMNAGADITDALWWTAQENKALALQVLINAGSNVVGKSVIIAMVKELIHNNNNAVKEILSDLTNKGVSTGDILIDLVDRNNLLALAEVIKAIADDKAHKTADAKTAALRVAAQNNNDEACVMLINSEANITDTLLWAARENNVLALKTLVNARADVNMVSKSGVTALIEGLIYNNDAAIKYLVDNGADVIQALVWAAKTNNNATTGILSALTKAGVNTENILIYSVENNNLSTLIEVTKTIADDRTQEMADAKTAALKVAAQNNNAEACVMLINSGANITDTLLWAARENNVPALKSLIKEAEDISDTDFAKKLELAKTAALTEAVRHNHVECAQYLMDSEAKITDTLLWAARENNIPALEILINAGANVNTTAGKNALNEAACFDSAEAMEYLIIQVERPIVQESTNAQSSLVNEEQTITTSSNSIVRTHTPITIGHQPSVTQTPLTNMDNHLINIKPLLILAAKNNSYKAIGILDKYINDAANVVADVLSCPNDNCFRDSNALKNIERLTAVEEVSRKAKSDALIVAAYYGNDDAVQALIKAGAGIENTVKIDDENLGQTINNILKSLPSGMVQSGSSVSTENNTESEANERQASSAKRPDNSSMIDLLQRLQKIQAEIGAVTNKRDLSKLIDCESPHSSESALINRFVRELVFRSDVELCNKTQKLILTHADRFKAPLFPKCYYESKLRSADYLIKPALLSEVLSAPPSEVFDNKKYNTKFCQKLLAILKSWQAQEVSTGSWRSQDIERLTRHVNNIAMKPKENFFRRSLLAFSCVKPNRITASGNRNVPDPDNMASLRGSVVSSSSRHDSANLSNSAVLNTPSHSSSSTNPEPKNSDKTRRGSGKGVKTNGSFVYVVSPKNTTPPHSSSSTNPEPKNSDNTRRGSGKGVKTNGSLVYGGSSPRSTPPEHDDSSVSSALAHSTETAHTRIAINHGVQQ